MDYHIYKTKPTIKGTIQLPLSKSISHRLLILEQLLPTNGLHFQHLSASHDTWLMQKALQQMAQAQALTSTCLNLEDAGTPLRFLTAYAATQKGLWLIEGCQRMHQRPIGALVDALQQIGANISYLSNRGFPPLLIDGKTLEGGSIEIDASISSQFISALMLIAPTTTQGIKIRLKGKQVSTPYVLMTLQLMQQLGFSISLNKNTISIPSQKAKTSPLHLTIESDWSAASYWYEMVALSEEADLLLLGLHANSLQGDAALAQYYNTLGVASCFCKEGLRLSRKARQLHTHFTANLSQQPDMVPALVCTLAALQTPATISGIANLRLKETDRLNALKNELKKLNCKIVLHKDSLQLYPQTFPQTTTYIHTYQDHRMAMAFATLAIKTGNIQIENADCVKKSYPHFWEDLSSCEFVITEMKNSAE